MDDWTLERIENKLKRPRLNEKQEKSELHVGTNVEKNNRQYTNNVSLGQQRDGRKEIKKNTLLAKYIVMYTPWPFVF